ncbi:ferrochelatase [Oceanospirillum sp. D5]|uniref:Ferrochelatase n=2 Tax=Oceanospirillum sediminis TaxID=2760088 RepID=A0A839IWB5_9GAMM|nr:ferrochelatase [Oceanospirillum sediminis]MBB1489248.1 ferrochelatase [Oceanospirillum sediminis]
MLKKKQGILLVNLGTPDAPTPAAVKRYLAEFLHDYRVVDLSRWLWCPILHGIILNTRPKRVAAAYASIWTEQGSPLLAISQQQQKALQAKLKYDGYDIPVELAMTYGNPSMSAGLDALVAKGVEEIIVLPLYPQYSATTTGAVFDQLARVIAKRREFPAITFIRDYYQSESYIEALANSVREHWQEKGKGNRLLVSFHGIPQRYADNGDPYPEHCKATARALADKLELEDRQWICSFQSRFGKEEWIKPYTDVTLEQWAEEIERVDVICPAFSVDCLETLEEIQVENRDLFVEKGGQELSYIPALNDRPDHIEMMAELVRQKLNS